MIWLFLLCSLGLPAGFLLMRRIPLCPSIKLREDVAVSLIVPARNEEQNLPRLLDSVVRAQVRPDEIIVVDDASADRTAEVAQEYGARVFRSEDLPTGWIGKTWACHQGARAAQNNLFLFLDADTSFDTDGCEKMLSAFLEAKDPNAAFSILPYHRVEKPYEELSLFFHLLMAIGAGGFGALGNPRLFGQSLLISRETYERSGGHAGVRRSILENFVLSSRVLASGCHCICRGGRGTLNIRMFPDGFGQLCEGWTKAFAAGAAASDPLILAVAVFWLSTLASSVLFVIFQGGVGRFYSALLYLFFVAQLISFSRQIGNYRVLSCVLFPLPLAFYFGIFAQSWYCGVFKRGVTWRGRKI